MGTTSDATPSAVTNAPPGPTALSKADLAAAALDQLQAEHDSLEKKQLRRVAEITQAMVDFSLAQGTVLSPELCRELQLVRTDLPDSRDPGKMCSTSGSSDGDDRRSPSPPQPREPHILHEALRPYRDKDERFKDHSNIPPPHARATPGGGHSRPANSVHQHRFKNGTTVFREISQRLVQDSHYGRPPRSHGLDGSANGLATPSRCPRNWESSLPVSKRTRVYQISRHSRPGLSAFSVLLNSTVSSVFLQGHLHVQLAAGYLDGNAAGYLDQSEDRNAPQCGWTFSGALASRADHLFRQFSSEQAARILSCLRRDKHPFNQFFCGEWNLSCGQIASLSINAPALRRRPLCRHRRRRYW
jgi:hypothetical protein